MTSRIPTIAPEPDRSGVRVLDQTRLPHRVETLLLGDVEAAARAIETMVVRGAPLIGATAAWGLWLAMTADPSDSALARATTRLAATRPTAVNLRWALERMAGVLAPLDPSARREAAWIEAGRIADEDRAANAAIGRHGLGLIEGLTRRGDLSGPVQIMTHCNAGRLATVDIGTATAPIYAAHAAGLPVHVWVSETRPRNQGAFLTAWELAEAGVPFTVIADNAAGHLMTSGLVDIVFVGADRVAANGDAANKIGTYLKALAAADQGVPFYVCLPSSTIDWRLAHGCDIPIEERGEDEVMLLSGLADHGATRTIRLVPEGWRAANPAFDVTPARLINGLVTECGVAPASREGLAALFDR